MEIIAKNLFEEDIDPVIDDIVNDKNFVESDTELETYPSVEELQYPQEYDPNQRNVIILDDFNEKK